MENSYNEMKGILFEDLTDTTEVVGTKLAIRGTTQKLGAPQ